jgi:hypothetical protein
MSLARNVHSVTVDLEQLTRLYRQLLNVPYQVQHLFLKIQETYEILKETESVLATSSVHAWNDDIIYRFLDYKDCLIDIELLVDPEQDLPHSGPGSDAIGVVEWNVDEDITSCGIFEGYLTEIYVECQDILLKLHRYDFLV